MRRTVSSRSCQTLVHIGVVVQDIRSHIISTSADLFEFAVRTGKPALVAGMCKVTYIDDVILVGRGVSAD